MRGARHGFGYSLVEMLVVLLIVGILTVLAALGYRRAQTVAHENRAVATMRAIVTAQTACHAARGRFGTFPILLDELEAISAGLIRGVGGVGGSETISDGRYDYSLRFERDAAGFTLDADPKAPYAGRYRRFRIRVRGGRADRRTGVLLVSPPSVASPPDEAYTTFRE